MWLQLRLAIQVANYKWLALALPFSMVIRKGLQITNHTIWKFDTNLFYIGWEAPSICVLLAVFFAEAFSCKKSEFTAKNDKFRWTVDPRRALQSPAEPKPGRDPAQRPLRTPLRGEFLRRASQSLCPSSISENWRSPVAKKDWTTIHVRFCNVMVSLRLPFKLLGLRFHTFSGNDECNHYTADYIK